MLHAPRTSRSAFAYNSQFSIVRLQMIDVCLDVCAPTTLCFIEPMFDQGFVQSKYHPPSWVLRCWLVARFRISRTVQMQLFAVSVPTIYLKSVD